MIVIPMMQVQINLPGGAMKISFVKWINKVYLLQRHIEWYGVMKKQIQWNEEF